MPIHRQVYIYIYYRYGLGVSINGGIYQYIPSMAQWMVQWKIRLQMDDLGVYPHFRKPPYDIQIGWPSNTLHMMSNNSLLPAEKTGTLDLPQTLRPPGDCGPMKQTLLNLGDGGDSQGTLWLCQNNGGQSHLYCFFPLNIMIFHSYVKLPESMCSTCSFS